MEKALLIVYRKNGDNLCNSNSFVWIYFTKEHCISLGYNADNPIEWGLYKRNSIYDMQAKENFIVSNILTEKCIKNIMEKINEEDQRTLEQRRKYKFKSDIANVKVFFNISDEQFKQNSYDESHILVVKTKFESQQIYIYLYRNGRDPEFFSDSSLNLEREIHEKYDKFLENMSRSS